MNDANERKPDSDCLDVSCLDAEFSQILTSHSQHTEFASEVTVDVKSQNESTQDWRQHRKLDLPADTKEKPSALGISPIAHNARETPPESGAMQYRDPTNPSIRESETIFDRNENRAKRHTSLSKDAFLINYLCGGEILSKPKNKGESATLTCSTPRLSQNEFECGDAINYEYLQGSNGKGLSRFDTERYRDSTSAFVDHGQSLQEHLTGITRGAAQIEADSQSLVRSSNSKSRNSGLSNPGSKGTRVSTHSLTSQHQRGQQRSSNHRKPQRLQHRQRQSLQSASLSSPSLSSPSLKPGKESGSHFHISTREKAESPSLAGADDTVGASQKKDNGGAGLKVMNNYTSLLDGQYAMANSNITRQAPSPGQSQHQSNGIVGSNNISNGVNGNAGNNTSIGAGGTVGGNSNGAAGTGAGMGLLNGLPSAGHQTDMNYLWSVVQQLSEVLADNRAQTAGIVRSVQHLQTRAAAEGISPILGEVNGEINGASMLPSSNGSVNSLNNNNNANNSSNNTSTNPPSMNSSFPPSSSQNTTSSATAHAGAPTSTITTSPTAADLLSLQTLLTASDRRATALESHTADLRSLLNDYEAAMQHILDKLRTYAYNHTHALIALHAHYNGLLTTERNTNLELRLEHQGWQAGLARVAEYARVALREQADGRLPYLRRIAALKGENQVLRRLAGWEPGPDGDGSESGSEVDGEREFERMGSLGGRDLGRDLERERDREGKQERGEGERDEQRLVGTLLG